MLIEPRERNSEIQVDITQAAMRPFAVSQDVVKGCLQDVNSCLIAFMLDQSRPKRCKGSN